MMISIIHPSRGRYFKGTQAAVDIINKILPPFGEPSAFEYIFSLDLDDPQLPMYEQEIHTLKLKYPEVDFEIICAENNNVVQAMNTGAKKAKGDVLVCTSDDFEFPQGWNIHIKLDSERPQALIVNQGIKKYSTNMAIPIMTMAMYNALSYIYYPEYTGMFADDDLTEACKVHGELIHAPDLLFQHNHYLNGKSEMDDTYKRHNNKESWELGKRIFDQRKLNGFLS